MPGRGGIECTLRTIQIVEFMAANSLDRLVRVVGYESKSPRLTCVGVAHDHTIHHLAKVT